MSGDPGISESILRKIANCDVFVADVSIANRKRFFHLRSQRQTPTLMFWSGDPILTSMIERVGPMQIA
jgi:hypothetical protein